MIDFKQIFRQVDEDAMVAGGAIDGGIVNGNDGIAGTMGSGLRTDDILGKDCDHKKDGYMGAKCNHIPKPLKLSTDGTIRKKKHTPYEKGMTIITDAELNRSTILAIHKVKENELRNYILKYFHDEIYDAMYVQAIAYFPNTKTFFAKVENDEKWSYVNLDFSNGKFKTTDDLNVYSSDEIKDKYHDEARTDMKAWVVWGGI